MYNYKINFSLDEWENKIKKETLNLFLNEEYGYRPFDITLKFEHKLVEERIVDDIVVSKMEMIYKDCHIRYFIYRSINQKKGSKAFIQVLHPFAYKDVTDEFSLDEIKITPVREIIKRGYVVANIRCGDAALDSKGGEYSNLFKTMNIERTDNSMGVLSMWAFTASKVLDYFETYEYVDASKVAVIGHSRGGKTALLAAVLDQRFYLSISNDSGNSGACLSRTPIGEKIENITYNFPYWFCENYKKYAKNEESLPFDQHLFIGLIAPRHVCVASATLDEWADPDGELLSAKYASQIYELYGLKGLVIEDNFEIDKLYGDGYISYHRRTGPHGLKLEDWIFYMDYFDKII